jgi:hypothetical protein
MTIATDMLAKYIAAEQAILEGKEVRGPDGRSLKMEDLEAVRAGRKEWEDKVAQETAAGQSTGNQATVGSIGGRGFSLARMNK